MKGKRKSSANSTMLPSNGVDDQAIEIPAPRTSNRTPTALQPRRCIRFFASIIRSVAALQSRCRHQIIRSTAAIIRSAPHRRLFILPPSFLCNLPLYPHCSILTI
ncbi:hypothetical protein LINPERHAP1_LOCUS37500 [Linum perenne]